MAFDFSSDVQFSLTSCSSHWLSKCTDFITRYYDSCFYGYIEQSYPLYCSFYAITYSGSMQKHAEFVTMLCRACGMFNDCHIEKGLRYVPLSVSHKHAMNSIRKTKRMKLDHDFEVQEVSDGNSMSWKWFRTK